ncbi:MAG: hypothetical protein BWY59_00900 [Verrucomicrobia bacterium ADurb.Bin345]|nr:MAG: hypothetical protein BWY59_00900 [Verrucomicrobia bacterium ADurb.Bin345]
MRRAECRDALHQQFVAARRDQNALLEGVLQSFHLVAGQVEGVRRGAVVQLEEFRHLVHGVVHDLVDDHVVPRIHIRAGVIDVERHRRPDLAPVFIVAGNDDRARAGRDRHGHRPVRYGGPRHVIGNPVELQRVDLDRRAAGQGNHVAVRADASGRQAEVRQRVQLAEEVRAPLADPGLEGRQPQPGLQRHVGAPGRHAVCDQRVVRLVDDRIQLRAEHGDGGRVAQRLPVVATERRVTDHPRHDRRVVADVKHAGVRPREVVDFHSKAEVQVPGEHVPAPLGRTVHERVLAAIIAVSVPVGDGVPEREHPHPLLHVRHRLKRRGVLVVGKIRRIHETHQAGVVVVESRVGALLPVPAVAGLLLVAARRHVHAEIGIRHHKIIRIERVYFDPVIHLVRLALVGIGEPGAEVVPLDVVGVRVGIRMLNAVQEHENVSLVTHGQTHVRRNLEPDSLAHARRIPVVGFQGVHVQFVVAQERLVRRELHAVRAAAFIELRLAESRTDEGTAAPSDPCVVDHPLVPIDECGIQVFVALFHPVAPLVDVRLRQPEPVGAEIAEGVAVAESHDALLFRILVGEDGCRRARMAVPRLHVKDHPRPARLRRDRSAVHTAVHVRHVHRDDGR